MINFEQIGVVLSFNSLGHSRPCGQTIGANGSGSQCFIIVGDVDSSENRARCIIREFERMGHRIDDVVLVRREPNYSGPSLHLEDIREEVP